MNTSEAIELIGSIQLLWPGTKLTTDAAEEWERVLGVYTLKDAQAAVNTFGADGGKYAPNPYQIRNLCDAARPRQEKRNIAGEKRLAEQYVNQGMAPLITQNAYGHLVVSWMRKERAAMLGRLQHMKYLGVPMDTYWMSPHE